MKKRSIVFIIISAIVMLIGIAICYIGVRTASATGEQIYATKIGEDRVYTYDFGGKDDNVDKIKINVTDANINIYGKSERSYIEVINFNENLSSYSANNAMITFRETTQVKDIAGLWESGLSFKGLRYILRPVPSDKQKTVNIYLEKDEYVKAFDITLERGIVTVENVSTLTDYHMDIESGKVKFTDVVTESGISISSDGDMSTDVTFEGVSADMFTLKAKHAKFYGGSFTVNTCELEVNAGLAEFEFIPKNPEYTINIASRGGIKVDGNTGFGDKFVYPPEDDSITSSPGTEDDKGGEKEEDEEEAQPSSLTITGENFSVNLTTPEGAAIEGAEDTDAAEDTATAVQ